MCACLFTFLCLIVIQQKHFSDCTSVLVQSQRSDLYILPAVQEATGDWPWQCCVIHHLLRQEKFWVAQWLTGANCDPGLEGQGRAVVRSVLEERRKIWTWGKTILERTPGSQRQLFLPCGWIKACGESYRSPGYGKNYLMPPLPERTDDQYSITERFESCFFSILGLGAWRLCVLDKCYST